MSPLLPAPLRGRRLLIPIFVVLLFCIWLLSPSQETRSAFYQRMGSSLQFSSARTEHPVSRLVDLYRKQFDAVLSRQSKTLQEAIDEYRRRYHREPPQGFDKWFNYARSRRSLIIDEFDMITTTLEPYWKFSGLHLRQNMYAALQHGELCYFSIQDGKFIPRGTMWIGKQILTALEEDGIEELPDVTLMYNTLDEPRVLITGDYVDRPGEINFVNGSHLHADWDRFTKSCHSRRKVSSAVERAPTEAIEAFGLPFVTDIWKEKDICSHSDYQSEHGMFLSPSTLQYTMSAVPIFTQAKPSTFSDILYPNHYYGNKYEDPDDYREDQDPPWEEKLNRLSWAGSTTGSAGKPDTWRDSHRQRFVTLTSQLDENVTSTFLSEVQPGVWRTFQSREIFGQLYDARFTAVIQCDPGVCEAEEEFFHPGARQNRTELWRSRFLFDLDGNTFSGRYYSLLRSRSVVLKQTVLQEWHDDRLFPWVHYVPVSMSMEELPEVMRYLALTKAGEPIAKQIANQGREWANRALRKEDFGVYYYRLILEYARLMNETREAGKYD